MAVQSLLWIALPTVVYGLLAACLPPPGPPPRWRRRLRRTTESLGERWRTRRRRRRPSEPEPVDPFEVLALQVRLGLLATQLRMLEEDDQVWARGRRLEATRAAYDDLLGEACRMAGVETTDGLGRLTRGEPERFREEIELTARGWSW